MPHNNTLYHHLNHLLSPQTNHRIGLFDLSVKINFKGETEELRAAHHKHDEQSQKEGIMNYITYYQGQRGSSFLGIKSVELNSIDLGKIDFVCERDNLGVHLIYPLNEEKEQVDD